MASWYSMSIFLFETKQQEELILTSFNRSFCQNIFNIWLISWPITRLWTNLKLTHDKLVLGIFWQFSIYHPLTNLSMFTCRLSVWSRTHLDISDLKWFLKSQRISAISLKICLYFIIFWMNDTTISLLGFAFYIYFSIGLSITNNLSIVETSLLFF